MPNHVGRCLQPLRSWTEFNTEHWLSASPPPGGVGTKVNGVWSWPAESSVGASKEVLHYNGI